MLRPRALALACTCLLVATLLGAAPSDPKPLDPYAELQAANKRLADENAALQRRVADLEALNGVLQGQLAQMRNRAIPAPAPVPIPAPAPDQPRPFQMPGAGQRVPTPGPEWTPREFNGQTIYIIPCETGNGPTVSIKSKVTGGTIAAPPTNPSAAAPAR